MLIAVNQTDVVETDVKIKDIIRYINRYNPVTYEQHLFPEDIELSYRTIRQLFVDVALKDRLISLKADALDRSYRAYLDKEITPEIFKYQMSLLYLDYQAREVIKSMSIGKHKFTLVTVDLFPKDFSIKSLLGSYELATSYTENLFELLDRGLISLITFKDNHSDYPDTLGLLKDKLFHRMRVRYDFMKNSPSSYRYSVLYTLLRGVNKNISLNRKEDGSTTKSEFDIFSQHLDKLGREQAFSKSKVGISIL